MFKSIFHFIKETSSWLLILFKLLLVPVGMFFYLPYHVWKNIINNPDYRHDELINREQRPRVELWGEEDDTRDDI